MKTAIGYKLFEEDKNGNLFPLFIGKNEIVEMNKWLKAQYIPTKGFAKRGGWHIGEMPDAPWLKGYDGSDTGIYKSQRGKSFKRVWCVVEYNATNDYNEEVAKLSKKCFEDRCPENGFYFFTECGKGVWSITSDIKVIKKLTEEERQQILKDMNHDEVEAYKPYKKAFEKRQHNKMVNDIRYMKRSA